MTDILRNMEPRYLNPESVIYKELDQITEVIFITNGQFDLGFEVNGQITFVLRYQNSTSYNVKSYGEAIGEYGCTFNKNSRFIYQTTIRCEGYFIRKKQWGVMMKDHAYIFRSYRA